MANPSHTFAQCPQPLLLSWGRIIFYITTSTGSATAGAGMSKDSVSSGFDYFTEVFSKEYKVDKSVLSGVARQVWENELTDADRASWEEMARQSSQGAENIAESVETEDDEEFTVLAEGHAGEAPSFHAADNATEEEEEYDEPQARAAASTPAGAQDDDLLLDLEDIKIEDPALGMPQALGVEAPSEQDDAEDEAAAAPAADDDEELEDLEDIQLEDLMPAAAEESALAPVAMPVEQEVASSAQAPEHDAEEEDLEPLQVPYEAPAASDVAAESPAAEDAPAEDEDAEPMLLEDKAITANFAPEAVETMLGGSAPSSEAQPLKESAQESPEGHGAPVAPLETASGLATASGDSPPPAAKSHQDDFPTPGAPTMDAPETDASGAESSGTESSAPEKEPAAALSFVSGALQQEREAPLAAPDAAASTPPNQPPAGAGQEPALQAGTVQSPTSADRFGAESAGMHEPAGHDDDEDVMSLEDLIPAEERAAIAGHPPTAAPAAPMADASILTTQDQSPALPEVQGAPAPAHAAMVGLSADPAVAAEEFTFQLEETGIQKADFPAPEGPPASPPVPSPEAAATPTQASAPTPPYQPEPQAAVTPSRSAPDAADSLESLDAATSMALKQDAAPPAAPEMAPVPPPEPAPGLPQEMDQKQATEKVQEQAHEQVMASASKQAPVSASIPPLAEQAPASFPVDATMKGAELAEATADASSTPPIDLQREILSRLAAKHPLSGQTPPATGGLESLLGAAMPASDTQFGTAAAAPPAAAEKNAHSSAGAGSSASAATPSAPEDAAGALASPQAAATISPPPPLIGAASKDAAAGASAKAPTVEEKPTTADRAGVTGRFGSPSRTQRVSAEATSGRTRREAKGDPRGEASKERPLMPQQSVHPAIFSKIRQYLEDHALALTKGMVERALKGDSQCLTWCMDRIWPTPGAAAASLEIPEFTSREEVASFGNAVLQALSQGGLTLEQANGYMDVLETYANILEMEDLKQRVVSLEQSARGSGSAAKRQKITLGAFEKPF